MKRMIIDVIELTKNLSTESVDMNKYGVDFALYVIKAMAKINVEPLDRLSETVELCKKIVCTSDFLHLEMKYNITESLTVDAIKELKTLDDKGNILATIVVNMGAKYTAHKIMLVNECIQFINVSCKKNFNSTSSWEWKKAI